MDYDAFSMCILFVLYLQVYQTCHLLDQTGDWLLSLFDEIGSSECTFSWKFWDGSMVLDDQLMILSSHETASSELKEFSSQWDGSAVIEN